MLEKLSHESIIRYLESFIEDNEMYIAVEWAEKGDLKLLLRTLKAKEQFLEEKLVWMYLL